MKVAISGVSGYIGGRLLSRLAGAEDIETVVGIDVRPPSQRPAKLKFYRRDVSRPFVDCLAEEKIDSAVHLAFVLKPARDRDAARRTDLGGASNFLEACHRAQVKHILYLSSHTTYGAHPDNPLPLTEDSPPRLLRSFQYSWDKAEAEAAFRDFARAHPGVFVTILRCCPVIGPNAGKSVVASMFKRVMVRIAGYDPPLQFLHEDDLVEVMMTFLNRRQAGIYNVAGDGEVRYSHIAALCGRRMVALPEGLLRLLLSLSWALHLQNESPASGLEFIKYPPLMSTEKLKSEVGFRFRYSSEEALVSFFSAWG